MGAAETALLLDGRGEHRTVAAGPTGCLLHELEDLEHRQIHGDDDAADDAADDHDHQRLYDRGQRLDGGVYLRLVELSYLGEHSVYVPGLLSDGYHAGDHRREDRLALQRLVDRDALPDRIPTL